MIIDAKAARLARIFTQSGVPPLCGVETARLDSAKSASVEDREFTTSISLLALADVAKAVVVGLRLTPLLAKLNADPVLVTPVCTVLVSKNIQDEQRVPQT